MSADEAFPRPHFEVVKLESPVRRRNQLHFYAVRNNRTGRTPASYTRPTERDARRVVIFLHERDRLVAKMAREREAWKR